MNIVMAILIGAISSLIASVMFLKLVQFIRPTIAISPQIARYYNKDNKKTYAIKVINKSRRAAINIEAELCMMVNDKKLIKTNMLSLERNKLFILFKNKKYQKKGKSEKYSFRFITTDDIDAIFKEGHYEKVRISILVHDELSGFGKVFTKKYKKGDIEDGKFAVANSFKIEKDDISTKSDNTPPHFHKSETTYYSHSETIYQ